VRQPEACEGRMPDLWEELYRGAPFPQGHEHPAWRTMDEYQDISHGITQVGIARSACFGECPVYDAVIHASGVVQYSGRMYVPRVGDHRGRVALYGFQRLAQFICGTRFWDLAPHYDFRDAVVSDAPRSCVLVATADRRKLVSNYADAGPPELWAIAELIDLLLQGVEWEQKQAEPGAAPDTAR
ncbi:DUF6438 domain-containing protein, partial [Gemmata sp. JC717]|uniref:DUF6438 domain-containing protein n=1 Tax=Gemmata algarum TaxID=2975278 RepID=UPI0021BA4FAA